ncbi:unnamed protein product [Adineta steineri]|uniref:Non-specific serine/threonine protein kinase n=1 Tax=Adineta steineri TaxID=433720 RepID=A0A813RHK0_9BILA|nr:unnamed protein product [Adineta steineri]
MASLTDTRTSDNSLLCPLTLELFRDPVLAQDGHTYERVAIEEWIRKTGSSPLTRQPLCMEHLYPNLVVKKIIDNFEALTRNKKYQFILDVDVKKAKGRPLFQTYGKSIFNAEWLPTNENRPKILILKINGARASKEASFYVELSRHPHIVRTFGFVGNKNMNDDIDSIMLLQECAPEGSLYELLDERETVPDEKILIEIFLQIIDAMICLADNHVVHGDLACRNILVFRFDETDPEKIVVKVTDFGLSRHSKLYLLASSVASHTTLNIIPYRYAAPEILSANATPEVYTEKSDIYSMGVLMWEAYCGGKIPWSKIERDDDVIQRVTNGDRLSQPSNCSSQYWSIIVKTWSKSPHDRPTFRELKRLLTEQYYQKGKLFKYSSLYYPHTTTQPLLPLLFNIHLNDRWTQDGITIAGHDFAELHQPHGLYVTDDQTIYVADYHNHRIMEWVFGASSGRVVARGSRAFENDDQIGYPTDVIFDKRTNSVISCGLINRGVVRWPRHDGMNGQNIISKVSCRGLAMDSEGYLYVSDYVKHEVRRWRVGETEGTIVAGANGQGNRLDQLDYPTYIFVDQNQSIYISDTFNHRVVKWLQEAKAGIVVAGGRGEGNDVTQLRNPQQVVVDQSGIVYVADCGNHRIMCWFQGADKGSVVVGGNGMGNEANQFNDPTGLEIDLQGNLYVADTQNHRVQKFLINTLR